MNYDNYIYKLSAEEKAHLLFTIFPEEQEFFLLTLKTMIERIFKNQSAFKNEWHEKPHKTNLHTFIHHARQVKLQFEYNAAQISADTNYMVTVLFHDNARVFTLHCLQSLVNNMSDNLRYNRLTTFFFFQQQEELPVNNN